MITFYLFWKYMIESNRKIVLTFLLIFLAITTFSQVTNGLIAKYSFDNGNANDEIGTNHGTVNGPILTNDRFGNSDHAYQFSANEISMDSMDLGSLSSVSVSVWVKPSSTSATSGNNTIMTMGGHWAIYLNRFTTRRVLGVFDGSSSNNNSAHESNAIPINSWTHILAMNDGSTSQLYINGVLEATFPETFSWMNKVHLVLGEHVFGGIDFYYGDMDDLRIYGRVLNQLEIDSLFTLPNPVCTSYDTIPVAACGDYLSPSGKFNWTTSGTYFDTLQNTAGCDSFLTINLTINSIDTSVSGISGGFISLTNNALYQWLDCDSGYSPISGAIFQSYNPTKSGNYAVEIDLNGCVDTSSCHSFVFVGDDELSRNGRFVVWPNPTKGLLTLTTPNVNRSIEINVRNAIGQIVSRHLFQPNEKMEFSIQGHSGIYFIEVMDDFKNRLDMIKVIKQ